MADGYVTVETVPAIVGAIDIAIAHHLSGRKYAIHISTPDTKDSASRRCGPAGSGAACLLVNCRLVKGGSWAAKQLARQQCPRYSSPVRWPCWASPIA